MEIIFQKSRKFLGNVAKQSKNSLHEWTAFPGKLQTHIENAKTQINSFLSQLSIEKAKLVSKNNNLERDIKKRNKFIAAAKKKNKELEDEKHRLENSDLGAVKQNLNFMKVYYLVRINITY